MTPEILARLTTVTQQAHLRQGPRPLAVQLSSTLSLYVAATGNLAAARDGALPWHPSLAEQAAELTVALAAADPAQVFANMSAHIGDRLKRFLDGVAAYQIHPYKRDLPRPEVAMWEGSTRVFDYGGKGKPVLFVPSLINPSYVLDLKAGRSMLRWMANNGLRPYLVNWGTPAAREADYDLGAYVQRLTRLIEGVTIHAGEKIALAGYCMGGTLAVAAAQLAPEHLTKLALLAAPWDFKADAAPVAAVFDKVLAKGPVDFGAGAGKVPMDIMQLFFASLDPTLTERKFRGFAALDPASERAEDFVAVEDWNNDGPPVAWGAARDSMRLWYIENRPMNGSWEVNGTVIRPERLRLPAFIAVPQKDRIVPAGSALALGEKIRCATIVRPPSGHVGMIVSARARDGLWKGLRDWVSGEMPLDSRAGKSVTKLREEQGLRNKQTIEEHERIEG